MTEGVHRHAVRIYYEDTDASGIVYHASYVRFFERGRSELLRSLDLDHRAMLDHADPTAYAVRRMTLDFERPARLDDVVTVLTSVRSVSGARLYMDQRIESASGEVLVAAEVEIVCLTPAGKPRRLPEAARKAFGAVTLRHPTGS